MKILIIEDDHEKQKNLEAFVRENYGGAEISSAQSIGSGLRASIAGCEDLDLILLDMSMHNYDISSDEPSGGNPEAYAGRDLLAQLKLRGILVPVIVVTMFDSFDDDRSKMSLKQLTTSLLENYSPPFRATVHYDARQEGWRTALKSEISKIFLEK